MKIVRFLLVAGVLFSQAAVAGNVDQSTSDAEAAVAGGDLTGAQKILVKELKDLQGTQTLPAQSPEIDKLLSIVDSWIQSFDAKQKEDSERYIREGRANWPQQQKQMEQERRDSDARWQAAKAQGKTIRQFQTEEVQRKAPERAKKYREQSDKLCADLQEKIVGAKQRIELFSLAASIRKKMHVDTDEVAKKYEQSVQKEQSALKSYEEMLSISKIKDPKQLIQRGMTPKPADVFEGAFTTPVSQISGLRGGGFSWLGYNAWIRFKSAKPVTLKNANKYKKVNSKTLASQFLSLCPEDRSVLSESSNLECWQVGGTSANSSGQIMITNKKRGLYWYRAWGGS